MGKLRQLCHWLTGPETSIEVSAFVPPTHPLRQWADGLPWAPFVEATAQSLARRFVREMENRLLSIGSKVLPLALSWKDSSPRGSVEAQPLSNIKDIEARPFKLEGPLLRPMRLLWCASNRIVFPKERKDAVDWFA
jgi:hypothetical protein